VAGGDGVASQVIMGDFKGLGPGRTVSTIPGAFKLNTTKHAGPKRSSRPFPLRIVLGTLRGA